MDFEGNEELYKTSNLKFIEKNIDKEWDWNYGLSLNANITSKFIEKYIDKNWNWGLFGLSQNSNITVEFIEKYIDKDWNFNELFLNNSNITFDILDKYFKILIGKKNINYKILSSIPNIKLDFIENNINENWEWNYDGLSMNLDLDTNFVEKYIYKDWNWNWLCTHKNFKPEFFIKHIHKDWRFDMLAYNPHITSNFIKKYMIRSMCQWKYLYDFNIIDDKFILENNINFDTEKINLKKMKRLSILIKILPKIYDYNLIKLINNFTPDYIHES